MFSSINRLTILNAAGNILGAMGEVAYKMVGVHIIEGTFDNKNVLHNLWVMQMKQCHQLWWVQNRVMDHG